MAVQDAPADAPLRRDVRLLGGLLGRVLVEQEGPEFLELEERIRSLARRVRRGSRHPEELTTESRIAERHGRLYLDIGRNGYAQTMAAPYAVRARPGAPLSVPLDWSELDEFDPKRHTLRTIGERLALPDPWAGIGEAAGTLDRAHARLVGLAGPGQAGSTGSE